MPHASHKLELLLVPEVPETPLDRAEIEVLFGVWTARGNLDGDRPGRDVDSLVVGGFVRLWIDQPGRMWLYANQQGGFRARCPGCEQNIAGEFNRAFRDWKTGASRTVQCPHCGVTSDLNGCSLRPEGAFSTWAMVFSGVESIDLNEGIRQEIEAALGPLKMIVRRV